MFDVFEPSSAVSAPVRPSVSWLASWKSPVTLLVLMRLEIEVALMERSVRLARNMYRLLSATPARPATSMAIKLPMARANGRATQTNRPKPIFLWFLRCRGCLCVFYVYNQEFF